GGYVRRAATAGAGETVAIASLGVAVAGLVLSLFGRSLRPEASFCHLSSEAMSVVPADRRRELPDEPGVYLFRDARGRVQYVGKANSIRKRVASHFTNPSTRGGKDLVGRIDQIEALVVGTDAEAL